MIVERTVRALSAAAIVVTAVVVAVVAAAFAVYSGLNQLVGPAVAAAIVAAVFAVLAVAVALIASQQAGSERRDDNADTGAFDLGASLNLGGLGVTEKIGELVQERPLVATGVAVAVGLIAFRNPELVMMLARSVLKPARTDQDDRPSGRRR